MSPSDTCVILNPAARDGKSDQVIEIVGSSAAIWTTKDKGDGTTMARRAVAEGFGTVIAAGGDGTLNEVVNGLAAASQGVVCGILPLGTGNDFARTIGMPLEPDLAWKAILERRLQKVDVVALERERSERWFINMAVGGAIDQIHDKLTDDIKERWGPFAYLRAGAEAMSTLLAEMGPHRVELRLDDGDPIQLDAWSVAVANGRTVGGGIPVAPLAEVSDGLLDVVVVRGVRGVEMAKIAALVMMGKHLGDGTEVDDATTFFRRARSIEVSAVPTMPFTTDGEVSRGDVSFFTAHPGALEMIFCPVE